MQGPLNPFYNPFSQFARKLRSPSSDRCVVLSHQWGRLTALPAGGVYSSVIKAIVPFSHYVSGDYLDCRSAYLLKTIGLLILLLVMAIM